MALRTSTNKDQLMKRLCWHRKNQPDHYASISNTNIEFLEFFSYSKGKPSGTTSTHTHNKNHRDTCVHSGEKITPICSELTHNLHTHDVHMPEICTRPEICNDSWVFMQSCISYSNTNKIVAHHISTSYSCTTLHSCTNLHSCTTFEIVSNTDVHMHMHHPPFFK